jgi:Na+-translocating ferredoxin:NAD+ oxidoreductase RnfE subunit
MKEAYNILWYKDAFAVWEMRLFIMAGVVATITFVALLLTSSSWVLYTGYGITCAMLIAYCVCVGAEKMCNRRIRERGYTEVELEMWGLA